MILKRKPVTRLTRLVAFIRMHEGLSLEEGGWVGGGAARTVFQGEELRSKSDIDFFARDLNQSNIMFRSGQDHYRQQTIDKSRKTGTISVTGQATGLHEEPLYRMQYVCSSFHPNIEHLFQTFDFTICQFVTDGYEIVYTERAEQDLKDQVLDIEPEYHKLISRPARLIKYMNQGYEPRPGVLSWALDLNSKKTTVLDNLKVEHAY